MKKLFLVGRFKEAVTNGPIWDFQGVFSSKEKAVAACRDVMYFVAPVELNVEVPHESVDFPEIEYPLAKKELR